MDSNINDPVSVKALLEKLRVSQAWQELSAQHPQPETTASEPPATLPAPDAPPQLGQGDSPTNTVSKVAELLAQLKNTAPSPVTPQPYVNHYPEYQPAAPPPRSLPIPSSSKPPPPEPSDLRNVSFQTALRLISQLGDDPTFLSAIKELRAEQETLERRLWADREDIHKKYTDKVKVAQTKAKMIGGSISQHEAMMLQDAYQRELRTYDAERVLPAWDGLVSKQQAALESLSVPLMFISSVPKDQERQAQIIQVLLGLAGGDVSM